MEKDPSPLDTLRQLKEWLDAGAITPDEFQTLKQKLLFADSSAVPSATPPPVAAAPAPVVPEPSVERLTPLFPIEVVASEPPVESFISPATPPVLPPGTAPESVMPGALPPSLPEPAIVYTKPEPPLEPTTVAPVEIAPLLPPITHTAATGFSNEEEYVEQEVYTASRKSPLMTIVIVAAVLALLGLVGYLLMDDRGSERLTSTSRTDADSVAVQPEIGPQTEQIELPPVAAPETIRVAPVAPPIVAPAAVDTTATAVATPATPAPAATGAEAPAALSESAAKARVETIMQRYYADLQAAPFMASTFFAPQVERFYTMRSTTPAAINAELARTHFPEFLEGQTSIRPSTLQVGAPVADGSRVVTFVEDSKAFRQSLQKRQQTAAQMRVRFDKDFKIVYLRQEKLLENNFEE